MINLLPPKEKKELEKEEQYKVSLILGIILFSFLLFFSLILFLINIYITTELKIQENIYNMEKEMFESSGMLGLEEKIIVFTKNLSKLESFYENQKSLTKVLEELTNALPERFYITSFSWDKDSSRAYISGFAPIRDDLFELKANLEKKFEKVDFPQENWIKPPKNIEFSGSFTTNF